jgi:hypothetical protein
MLPTKRADMHDIDWSRMAEPQKDGYDSEVTWIMATSGSSPGRVQPWVRKERRPEDTTICGDLVVARYIDAPEMSPPHFEFAPLDHPHLAAAASYLTSWPEAYDQFTRLIDTVHPCFNPVSVRRHSQSALISCSHSYEEIFGAICVTVDHPLACAQAFVHEMAHQKLRALGVSNQRALRLITNDPERLYVSPIVSDRLRPMTAVLHAEYSFIYVTQLDLCMFDHEQDDLRRREILALISRNVPRVRSGRATIADAIETDEAGAAFVEAFLDWTDRVIERGEALLSNCRRHEG